MKTDRCVLLVAAILSGVGACAQEKRGDDVPPRVRGKQKLKRLADMERRIALKKAVLDAANQQRGVQSPRGSMYFGFYVDGRPVEVHVSGKDKLHVQYRGGRGFPAKQVISKPGLARFAAADGSIVAELTHWKNGGNLVVKPQKPKITIGLSVRPLDKVTAEFIKLDPAKVLHVVGVKEDGPAHEAGVRRNDLILEIDGKAPATEERLKKVLAGKSAGEVVRLQVQRLGKKQNIDITVQQQENVLQQRKRIDTLRQQLLELRGALPAGGGPGGAKNLRKAMEQYKKLMEKVRKDLGDDPGKGKNVRLDDPRFRGVDEKRLAQRLAQSIESVNKELALKRQGLTLTVRKAGELATTKPRNKWNSFLSVNGELLQVSGGFGALTRVRTPDGIGGIRRELREVKERLAALEKLLSKDK